MYLDQLFRAMQYLGQMLIHVCSRFQYLKVGFLHSGNSPLLSPTLLK